MNIRKINENDREEFLSLVKTFYNSEAVLHSIPESYHEKTFSELMRSDCYAECLFFEENNETVGYALLAKTFSQEAGGLAVWIEELYLKEQYRSKGFGSEFFNWLFVNVPAKRYRLEVEADNLRAKKMYEKMGFNILPYEQMVKDICDDK